MAFKTVKGRLGMHRGVFFMCQWSEMVKEFHKKHRHPVGVLLHDGKDYMKYQIKQRLTDTALTLINLSKSLEEIGIEESKYDDFRMYRAHLMIEELGETILALAHADQEKLFDGLLDLVYTVIGTGVTYGLPMEQGFIEVHRSNMTKPKRTKSDLRQRRKPKSYSPPDLEAVLAREKQYMEDLQYEFKSSLNTLRREAVRSRGTPTAARSAAAGKGTSNRNGHRRPRQARGRAGRRPQSVS